MKKIFAIIAAVYMYVSVNNIAGAQSWNITGNAGTNGTINFIGTTDNVGFKIRTKNLVRVTVSASGNVGIGITVPVFKLDVKGGSINTDSVYRISGNTVISVKGTNNFFAGINSGLSTTTGNENTTLGKNALSSNTTGSFNTASGINTLSSNTTGFYNTATGRNALFSNTTGYGNVAMGSVALNSNTTGGNNTAIGGGALSSNVAGSLAVAIGTNAMAYAYNTAAPFTNFNVAVGFEALRGSVTAANNSGNNNTAIGYQTLLSNTTGNFNTADGYQALTSNTTGYSNTADGSVALFSNISGFANCAIGLNALYSNTTGFFNTAIGVYALSSNVSGNYATAIGKGAMLYSNSTAAPFTNFNVAVGFEALRGSLTAANNTGNNNTATGYQALWSNTTGSQNTASGNQSLYSNTIGGNNTASGNFSLNLNTTGSGNTASGHYALSNNTTGGTNTAIGMVAFQANTTGSNNTGIGYSTNPSVGTLNYATAIGASAFVNASNKVRIGDAGIMVIEGQVVYSWPSDGRFKENVKDDVKGLDFILKLQPVSYNFNRLKFAQHVRQPLTADREKTLVEQSQNRSVGFIAQDVEKIIQQTGFTSFDAVHAPTNETDNYSMGYAEFVVPLVKAVQELNTELKMQNAELIKRIEALEQKNASENKTREVQLNNAAASLEQNQPNPFNAQTVIRYSVPSQFSSVIIQISDIGNKVLKTVVIKQPGKGELIIHAGEFAAGTYRYSLIVDERVIDRKQMVLTK